MHNRRAVLIRCVQWLSACIPGMALDFWMRIHAMTALHHAYTLRWTTILWGGVVFLVLRGLERIRCVLYRRMGIVYPPAPVLSMAVWGLLLIPIISARWFWTGEDLRIRFMSAAVIVGIAYVWLAWRDGIMHAIVRCSADTLLYIAVGLCFLVQGILGLGLAFPRLGLTGDEPHYLLLTESIILDHDLDVANNYRAPSALLQRIGVYPRDIHGRTRPDSTAVYSFHMPALALLQAPAYILSHVLHARNALWFRLTMVLITLWVTVECFRLLLMWTRSPPRAFLGTAVLTWTVPVGFYAHHLYPEVVVLGILLRALRIWAVSEAGRWQWPIMGFAIGTLPFWGVKYLGIIAAWGLLGCARLWHNRTMRRNTLHFLTSIAVGCALFFLFLYRVYGTIDPQKVYTERSLLHEILPADHPETGTLHHLWMRAQIMGTSTLNYLLDQRDGLLLYSPIYLLGLIGGVGGWRLNRRNVLPGAVILVAHIGIYSLGGARIGFSPPGRPFAPVAIIPILWLVANRLPVHRSWGRTLAEVLGLYSVLMPWYMAAEPHSIYQSTAWYVTQRAGRTFERLSHLLGYLPNFLPSYIQGMPGPWWPNYVWTLLLVGVIGGTAGYARRWRHTRRPATYAVSRGVFTVLAGVVVIWLAGFPRFVPETMMHTEIAPDMMWYYPEKTCTVHVAQPYIWSTTCRQRSALTFALAGKRTFHMARIRIFCYPVGRQFRAALRWFDVALRPAATVGSQTIYTVHWPFWPRFRGRSWLVLSIRARTPDVLPCRFFVMWIYPGTGVYSRSPLPEQTRTDCTGSTACGTGSRQQRTSTRAAAERIDTIYN